MTEQMTDVYSVLTELGDGAEYYGGGWHVTLGRSRCHTVRVFIIHLFTNPERLDFLPFLISLGSPKSPATYRPSYPASGYPRGAESCF
jgi:hypothetical protein